MWKKTAIINILIGMLIPLGYTFYKSSDLSDIHGWWLFISNLLLFWIAFLAICILYIRVHYAAVTGSALTVTSVFIGFAYVIESSGDPKAGALWFFYLAWCVAAFFVSLLFVWIKPKFFIKSSVNAFLLGMASVFLGYVFLFVIGEFLILIRN